MQDSRKYRRCLGLVCLLILLLAGTAGADYVDSTVLIPDADGAFNTWIGESGCTDHYDCVNDSSDAPCTADDTTTYVYNISGGVEQYQHTTAPDTSNSLDSMAMYVALAELVSGTGGDWKIAFGWRQDIEGEWFYCPNEGGLDTVDVDGFACVVYRYSWTKDPCFAETRGLGWVYFGWTFDNLWQPAVDVVSVESGCVPNCYLRLFNVWMVYYFMVTEVEGQVIIIGAKDEETYRNPRRGVCPRAWE